LNFYDPLKTCFFILIAHIAAILIPYSLENIKYSIFMQYPGIKNSGCRGVPINLILKQVSKFAAGLFHRQLTKISLLFGGTMRNALLIAGITIAIVFSGSELLNEKGFALENHMGSGIIRLPEPIEDGSVSVEKALRNRRSTKSFSEKELTIQDVAQLLWAAQGTTGDRGRRSAPSAGALYPLEIYVASSRVEKLPAGLYHYRSESHDLEIMAQGDHRMSLYEASLDQESVKNAPAVFLISGVFPRTMDKYGRRGMQYVLMEAGHAAQNLLLQAEALGLGHVPIGAFNDEVMRKVLKIDDNTFPLYILPVGHKK
jgi:SagB-type dehydrogenase family enzyme